MSGLRKPPNDLLFSVQQSQQCEHSAHQNRPGSRNEGNFQAHGARRAHVFRAILDSCPVRRHKPERSPEVFLLESFFPFSIIAPVGDMKKQS